MSENEKRDERIKYETEKCPQCGTVLEEGEVDDKAVSSSITKIYCPNCGRYNTFQ